VPAYRPPRGQRPTEREAAPTRPAASLMLLRAAREGPEVLLVRRYPSAPLLGGFWVFPGGTVRPDDRDPLAAACRELREEAGLRLGAEAAPVPFSRWITPAEVAPRFDTVFFAALAPPGAEPRPDGRECVDARWRRPADALAQHRRGELALVFPTIKHLEQLAAFASVEEVLDAARGREPVPLQPRVVVTDGTVRVLLPGDPGYGDRSRAGAARRGATGGARAGSKRR
jgi:8-oxo-dGTP pyrophosphatase MutT (NUDIX family)